MSAQLMLPASAPSRIGLTGNQANVSDRGTGRAGVYAVHVSVDPRYAAPITGPGVPPSGRLAILGLRSGYWPAFRTTAGMIGVVTAVLTGSDAGLLATIAAGHSAVAGFVTGGVVSVAVLAALMWFQYSAWTQAHQLRLFEDEHERPDAGVIGLSLTMAANRQLRSPTGAKTASQAA